MLQALISINTNKLEVYVYSCANNITVSSLSLYRTYIFAERNS